MTLASPSAGFRRGVAALCAAGFPVALLMVIVPSWRHATWAPIIWGLFGPYLVMIGHLNLTRELSSAEKAVWRQELWWSHRSLPAVWMYLLATDLRRTTKELAESA